MEKKKTYGPWPHCLFGLVENRDPYNGLVEKSPHNWVVSHYIYIYYIFMYKIPLTTRGSFFNCWKPNGMHGVALNLLLEDVNCLKPLTKSLPLNIDAWSDR